MTVVEFELWIVWLNFGMTSTREYNLTNWINLPQPEKGQLDRLNRDIYRDSLPTEEE